MGAFDFLKRNPAASAEPISQDDLYRRAAEANARKAARAARTAAPTSSSTALAERQWWRGTPSQAFAQAKPVIVENAKKLGGKALSNINTAAAGTVAVNDIKNTVGSNEGGLWNQVGETAMALPRVLGGAAGMDVDLDAMQRGLRPIEAGVNAAGGFLADRVGGLASRIGFGAGLATTNWRPATALVRARHGDSPITSMYRENFNTSVADMPGLIESAAMLPGVETPTTRRQTNQAAVRRTEPAATATTPTPSEQSAQLSTGAPAKEPEPDRIMVQQMLQGQGRTGGLYLSNLNPDIERTPETMKAIGDRAMANAGLAAWGTPEYANNGLRVALGQRAAQQAIRDGIAQRSGYANEAEMNADLRANSSGVAPWVADGPRVDSGLGGLLAAGLSAAAKVGAERRGLRRAELEAAREDRRLTREMASEDRRYAADSEASSRKYDADSRRQLGLANAQLQLAQLMRDIDKDDRENTRRNFQDFKMHGVDGDGKEVELHSAAKLAKDIARQRGEKEVSPGAQAIAKLTEFAGANAPGVQRGIDNSIRIKAGSKRKASLGDVLGSANVDFGDWWANSDVVDAETTDSSWFGNPGAISMRKAGKQGIDIGLALDELNRVAELEAAQKRKGK